MVDLFWMKIILFGSRGYLGGQFRKLYPDALCPAVDISDQGAVSALLEAEKPDIVLNAAGKTGRPNVDWCEDHKEETIRSNITGPLILLEECGKRGIYWVHMSSGCIYTGDNAGKGFAETDPPNFFGSFYSRTKAWSDQMLQEFGVLQLRIRMPFDGTTEDRNLIMKLRKYKKVLDVQNSITHLPDFFKAADMLIQKRLLGTYNLVNAGSISPYQIMELYQEIVDPSHTFEKLSLEDLSTVTKAGRSNCILSLAKLEKEGITMPNVQDALRTALQTIQEKGG